MGTFGDFIRAGRRKGLYPAFVIAVFVSLQLAIAAASAVTSTTTYHISNTTNGQDCTLIGVWDSGTLTCTLTTDVIVNGADGIHIDSDGVTLDGGGHTLTGNNTATTWGISIVGRTGVTVKNMTVNQFAVGVVLYSSNSNTLSGNSAFSNLEHGIALSGSSNNTISGNTVSSNGYEGIYLVGGSSNNTFMGNTVSSNLSFGIYLNSGSDNNRVYRNNFINNFASAYVFESAGTVFNLPLPDGGNYWSNHVSPDSDGDGIVDSPYAFTGGQDNYPWTSQNGWPTTFHISDNPSGGHCALIGDWNAGTSTCTLTTDLTVQGADGIHIDSDGLTLDGDSHMLAGNNTTGTVGVSLSARSGVTVKDLSVTQFEGGLHLESSSGNTLSGIGASENTAYGIWLNTLSDSNTLSGNSTRGNGNVGISLNGSSNNTLSENDASSNASRGIALVGSYSNTLSGNTGSNSGTGIWIYYSNSNTLSGNTASFTSGSGIELEGSTTNTLSGNTTASNYLYGISLITSSDGNILTSNTVGLNATGISFSNSSGNRVYRNNFLNNATQASVSGGSGNVFDLPLPTGGNFWSNWITPDSDVDGIVDSPYEFTGAQDSRPWTQQNGWQSGWARDYHFTWYDEIGGDNWVLMSNPVGADQLNFSLSVAGVAGFQYQTVPGGQTLPVRYPGVRGGPVVATSETGERAIVSQRILWPNGGSSLEEVLGTDVEKLSSHFYWSWYDQSPGSGFKNWVLVANPSLTQPVYYRIKIGGMVPAGGSGSIPAGQNVTPMFPGVIGGPVEVEGCQENFTAGESCPTPRKVMASQRVLSNGDTAFNEVPGIADVDLQNRYLWTWYDDLGGKNWVLVANPNPTPLYYEIRVAGELVASDDNVPIEPGMNVTPRFGVTDGPVEVKTFCDENHTDTTIGCSRAIASQRVIWGPSFEEVPGYAYAALSSSYHWTWYDQSAPGVTNWVLVANPSAGSDVYYRIFISGQPRTDCTLLPRNSRVTPTFAGAVGGPVEVHAYSDASCTVDAPEPGVMASQRVLWNGYFNEVLGTVLSG